MINTNNICMGCMEEKGDLKVCPKCGWVEGTERESPLHLYPGTILRDEYLIGRVLGYGGFGITYLARDINLGTQYAIKEYFPQGLATRTVEDNSISVFSGSKRECFEYGLNKFLDEARMLARFDEVPEIVTVRHFFRENGTAYLVMNYIDGITLKDYIKQRGGKLSLEEVLNIMLPVMKALEVVHKEGILHRDISPDNIYVTKNFKVKLLDFGAARYAMGEYSKSLSVILKPGYAPEEQYRTHGNCGPWTDVYAIGATIYTALTGHTPPEALDRLDTDTIKKPSELGIAIDKNIEDILMKTLAVKASARIQSIDEFETAIFDIIPDADENRTSSEREEKIVTGSKETSGIPKEEGEKFETRETPDDKKPKSSKGISSDDNRREKISSDVKEGNRELDNKEVEKNKNITGSKIEESEASNSTSVNNAEQLRKVRSKSVLIRAFILIIIAVMVIKYVQYRRDKAGGNIPDPTVSASIPASTSTSDTTVTDPNAFMQNGEGKYVYSNGETYDGQWLDGKPNGYGVQTFPDGEKYEGNFTKGLRQGYGVFTWPNGEKYEGNWENDKYNGKGIYTWLNGTKYEGNFINEVKQGYGVFTWPDGSKYEGNFSNGVMDGYGVYTWPNGDKYEGYWANDKRNGKGKLTFVNGQVQEGEWQDNVLIN